MDGAERVGDIELGHVGQLLGERGIVLLLAGIKAEIFQQQDLAGLQRGGLGLGILSHNVMGKGLRVFAGNVLGENALLPEQLAQTDGDGGETQTLLPLSLGLSEVGAGDDRRPAGEQGADGGQARDDALVAGDGAGLLVLGNIEIAAQENLLAGNVDVVDGLFMIVHTATLLMKYIQSLRCCYTRK